MSYFVCVGMSGVFAVKLCAYIAVNDTAYITTNVSLYPHKS